MSWGRSPSQGLGALGRSPFKGSTPRPFAPGESSSSGGSSRDLSGGGGGGDGTNGQGSEWTLLDERASRGPASCSPGTSASREFLMMAKHRRRSMSLDIPQHQHQNHHHHQQQQQQHNNYHHGKHHQPLPLHHHQHQHQRSSSAAFSSSPGGNPSSLSREFSGLSIGMGGTGSSATSNHSFRDRSSSSGAGSTVDGSAVGSASASGSTTGSTTGSIGGSGSGALRSGGASSSSFSSVASASETFTAMGATGAGGSESNLQRQIRARLEEAEQQTAYWQARAKEAEQAAVKSKTECVTLRCQLNAQQCTASSLDEVLVSMHARVERIRERLKAKSSVATAAAGFAESGNGRIGGEGGGDCYHSRPSVLENIELGLMGLEKQLLEEGAVRRGRIEGGRGTTAGAKDAYTMTIPDAAAATTPASTPSSPPILPTSVIHFRRFSPGDVALFFPTPAGDYLAFNVGCPHHYLSEESKALIGKDKHFRKYYVLGRITRLMKCQVPSVEDEEEGREGGRGAAGSVSKGPYNLAGGCRYAVVSVEPIKSL